MPDERQSSPARKKLLIGLLVVSFCFGVVVTRAIWEGRTALADGDSAHSGGDVHEAIARWRRSARWYVPGAPHVSDAYERLQALGEAAEQAGDTDMALRSWRAIRGSILATRSFFTPFPERLERANRHISVLMAAQEGAAADPSRNESERAEWHYQLLDRDESPSVFWSIIALIGLAVWIGAGVWFALRGVSDADKLVKPVASRAAALIVGGLAIWLLGLYYA